MNKNKVSLQVKNNNKKNKQGQGWFMTKIHNILNILVINNQETNLTIESNIIKYHGERKTEMI